jgi:uncharacterized protein
VRLLAEKAIYWPADRTLFVADLHWGKAAAFRSLAVPIPAGTTASDLTRLSRAIDRMSAERLVILGDLIHAKAGRQPETLAAISRWRAERPELEIVLVRGNHDEKAGDPPVAWSIRVVDEPEECGPFALRHFPEPVDGRHVLAGHLHPAAVLSGRGGPGLRLPCFHVGRDVTVLPAFGSFTGTATVKPRAEDSVFVIAEDEVIPFVLSNVAGEALPGGRTASG